MRRGMLASDGCEILGRGPVAEGLVGPMVVVAVGEGVDVSLQLVDPVGPVEAAVEFVAPGALGAFDGAVERGARWQQQGVEGEAAIGASLFDVGLERRSAVEPDAGDGERGLGAGLVKRGSAA